MKVKFVSVENSIITVGFRKMASLARSIHPETEVCFIASGNFHSVANWLFKMGEQETDLPDNEIMRIANFLGDADLLCFSSMTMLSELTKKVIAAVRSVNPKTYIIWGGIHPIVVPEDAMPHADAICRGEGETAFKTFFQAYKNGEDFTKTKNFWFNHEGEIIKNDFLPLHTAEEMSNFPLPIYADNEFIYKRGAGFVPLTASDYVGFNGLAYTTVWSIGCPYECSYCANTVFLENDRNYRKVRHPSIDYIINEVKQARKRHPHISCVSLYDDSFMAIPFVVMETFAMRWREEINIPFTIKGVIPAYVKKEKVEVLVWAGMNRINMGVQSGSDRILKFYERPNRPGLIAHATSIIGGFGEYMIPPTYDIILDNPIETRQDVIDTLEMIYNLSRPFMLNIFSLRIIPNTALAEAFRDMIESLPSIKSGVINAVQPRLGNILVFTLVLFRLPRIVFDFLLRFVKGNDEEQPRYPGILFVVNALYWIKRGLAHVWFMDFSVLPGKVGWWLWRLGIIKFWQKVVLKNPLSLRSTAIKGAKSLQAT